MFYKCGSLSTKTVFPQKVSVAHCSISVALLCNSVQRFMHHYTLYHCAFPSGRLLCTTMDEAGMTHTGCAQCTRVDQWSAGCPKKALVDMEMLKDTIYCTMAGACRHCGDFIQSSSKGHTGHWSRKH